MWQAIRVWTGSVLMLALISGCGESTPPLAAPQGSARILDMARNQHAAVLQPSGEVLLVGGVNGEGSLNTSELYTP